MTPDMRKVFQSFAGSMGEDIQSQLVAKGMTTKGPFTLAEVTYPDKKGADLTLTTGVIFDIQRSNPKVKASEYFENNVYGNIYTATMTVGIKVYFYMLEPMSEEKMFIKSLTSEFRISRLSGLRDKSNMLQAHSLTAAEVGIIHTGGEPQAFYYMTKESRHSLIY